MSVTAILWVSIANGLGDDFIIFQMNRSAFQHSRSQKFASKDEWFCTLGIRNIPFVVEPNPTCLETARCEPRHMYIAKDIGNTPFYSGSADFNQIDPPKGNLEGFADEIYRYANNFDRHSQPEKGEYIVGKFDGVAWVNSIFKKAGVSDAVRQKGGGRISPHPNMFDPMVFDLPTASAPGFIYPTDPMILAPGHRLHTIVEGDSLSKIAFNYYRDYQKWEKIYHYIDPHYRDWNKVKIGANPNLIFPGTKIIIPPLNAIL